MTEAIPTLPDQWARSQPDRVAVIADGLTLTASELDARADAAAEGLRQLGIGEGDIVGLRLQTTAQWVVLMLALSKLGARLLGVNWRLLAEDVNFLLVDARATLLVFDDEDAEAFVGSLTALARSAVVPACQLDPPASLLQVARPTLPLTGLCEQIIYTSGTTGKPKGIVLRWRPSGDERLRRYQADVASGHRRYGADDVVLVSMPLHHGSGSSQIKTALCKGATVVLQKRFSPANWFDLVERHGVTHWTGVPTMFKRLRTYQEQTGRKAPGVRSLGIAAAPVPMAIKRWIQDQFGSVLYESYGSTETGLLTLMRPQAHFSKPGSCGLPYQGVDIEIRRTDGSLCALGEEGEIWANTPVTITGYLNAPPLGVDTRDARGFLRVGDVGRCDADGYLHITDRAKDMIICGGVNIYPAEIESAFYLHPDVQDIAVIGVPDDEFGERVIAYYESKTGAPIADAELIEVGRKSLASYKRPRSYVHVIDLPRNAVGKVLKRELRQPHWARQERNV